MLPDEVGMSFYDQPSILQVGYKVKLHSLPGELNGHNGKVGMVMAMKFDEFDNGLVAVKMDNQEENDDVIIMILRTTNVELLSGNGYNTFILILQMPDNPDYIGQMIRCGEMKGGLTNGCPALVIAFDPATWGESFKNEIVEHMVVYSVTDGDGALNYIRMLEERLPRCFKTQ